jgi:hypothetical protein
MIRKELLAQRGRQFNPVYVDAMLSSPLIAQIHQAEDDGVTVLTREQIRQVLDGTCEDSESAVDDQVNTFA